MKYVKLFEEFTQDLNEEFEMGELYDIADELTQEDIVDITNTESEGEDCLRLDFGNEQSVWLYTSGSANGVAPAKMKQYLVKKGFVFESEQPIFEREISTEKRVALAKKGQAIPVKDKEGKIIDGRFPIENKQDFENAKKAYGRSKKRGVKQFIMDVAKKKGWEKDLPENW